MHSQVLVHVHLYPLCAAAYRSAPPKHPTRAEGTYASCLLLAPAAMLYFVPPITYHPRSRHSKHSNNALQQLLSCSTLECPIPCSLSTREDTRSHAFPCMPPACPWPPPLLRRVHPWLRCRKLAALTCRGRTSMIRSKISR